MNRMIFYKYKGATLFSCHLTFETDSLVQKSYIKIKNNNKDFWNNKPVCRWFFVEISDF